MQHDFSYELLDELGLIYPYISIDMYNYLFTDKNIKFPNIDNELLYECIADVYYLCDYTTKFTAVRDMPLDIVMIFTKENTMYHYQIEIVLAATSYLYCRNIKNKIKYHSMYAVKSQLKLLEEGDNVKDIIKENARNWDNVDNYIKLLEFKYKCPPHLIYVSESRNIYAVENEQYVGYINKSPFPIEYMYASRKSTLGSFIEGVSLQQGAICIPESELKLRIEKHIPRIFLNIDWKNDTSGICIAGGWLFSLCNDNLYNKSDYLKSDIDVFIYGKEKERKDSLLWNLLDKLQEDGYNLNFTRSLIDAQKDDIKLQIILSNCDHVIDVIRTFDLSHIQIAYNGSNIICTPKFSFFIQFGESIITSYQVRSSRLLKACRKGIHVVHGKKNIMINKDYYKYGGTRYIFRNNKLLSTSTLSYLKESNYNPIYIDINTFRQNHVYVPFDLSGYFSHLNITDFSSGIPNNILPLNQDDIQLFIVPIDSIRTSKSNSINTSMGPIILNIKDKIPYIAHDRIAFRFISKSQINEKRYRNIYLINGTALISIKKLNYGDNQYSAKLIKLYDVYYRNHQHGLYH